MFCWPCIIVHPYNETNVMHFLFNLLKIKGLYMFRALLAHPQEALPPQAALDMLHACYVSWPHQDRSGTGVSDGSSTPITLILLHWATLTFTLMLNSFCLWYVVIKLRAKETRLIFEMYDSWTPIVTNIRAGYPGSLGSTPYRDTVFCSTKWPYGPCGPRMLSSGYREPFLPQYIV
jgi:hypothetical protein